MSSLGLGSWGDPITPIFIGIKSLSTRWPAIFTFSLFNYASQMVTAALPTGESMTNRLIQNAALGAIQLARLETGEAVRQAYPTH